MEDRIRNKGWGRGGRPTGQGNRQKAQELREVGWKDGVGKDNRSGRGDTELQVLSQRPGIELELQVLQT